MLIAIPVLRRVAVLLLPAICLGACAFDAPQDVGYEVSGSVSGMWDGAATTLRLQTSDTDELLTVSSDGVFAFDDLLDDAESFTVSIETSPVAHSCTVVDGSSVIDGGNYASVAITCAGPVVDVAISAPVAFSFDPEQVEYHVPVSVLIQKASVVVVADDATSIEVDGTEVAGGVPSIPRDLSLGSNLVEVRIEVETLSRTFTVDLDRGSADISQHVYAKASDTDGGDHFGLSLAIDGDTLVVGCQGEDSSTRVINGQHDESRLESGAAFVFRRVGSVWQQEAFLKANNADVNDFFGTSVAISGSTVVVGARGEDGPTNATADVGAVYVFVRDGNQWQQQAVLRASDLSSVEFGGDVAISGDVVAVGEVGDGNSAYMFRRSGTIWTQQGGPIAPFAAPGSQTVVDVDGDVLVVGAPYGGGVVHVYRWNGTAWSPEETLEASVPDATTQFGGALAVRGDTIVVGDYLESSSGRGINPNDIDSGAATSGAVYVFERIDGAWSQSAFIKSSNSEAGDRFGVSVALSGEVLVVGASGERGAGTGIGADQTSNAASNAGATFVFRRAGDGWAQVEYLKASNTDPGDQFGAAVAAGRDTVAVGATFEGSDATGIDGSQGNVTGFAQSGAIYVFR